MTIIAVALPPMRCMTLLRKCSAMTATFLLIVCLLRPLHLRHDPVFQIILFRPVLFLSLVQRLRSEHFLQTIPRATAQRIGHDPANAVQLVIPGAGSASASTAACSSFHSFPYGGLAA